MVSDSNRASTDGGRGSREPDAGDSTPVEFDETSLYVVVRAAVEDALLDVIGTLLLVGIAFVLVLAGLRAVVESGSAAETVFGLAVAVVGVYLAAASLEVVPGIGEWL